jgi:hypothetical protein
MQREPGPEFTNCCSAVTGDEVYALEDFLAITAQGHGLYHGRFSTWMSDQTWTSGAMLQQKNA